MYFGNKLCFCLISVVVMIFHTNQVDGRHRNAEPSVSFFENNRIINNYYNLNSHKLSLNKLRDLFDNNFKHDKAALNVNHKRHNKLHHKTHVDNINHSNRNNFMKVAIKRSKPRITYYDSNADNDNNNYFNDYTDLNYLTQRPPVKKTFIDLTRNTFDNKNKNRETRSLDVKKYSRNENLPEDDVIDLISNIGENTRRRSRKKPVTSESDSASQSDSEEVSVEEKKPSSLPTDSDDNNKSGSASEASAESSEEETKKVKQSSQSSKGKVKERYVYMQGPGRLMKDSNLRRNMPYFLPKRYHWTLDDMKHLGYYWFDGP